MDDTVKFEVEEAAYHRNGSGGEGFYVGIATCEIDHQPMRMLITFFPHMDPDGAPYPAGKGPDGYANGRVAVVRTSLLPDVSFGTNSWRGDNFYKVADAIVKEASA